MTLKTVLAALLAAGLITSAAHAPVWAQDDEGTTTEEPADPGTEDSGADDSGGE